MKLVETIYVEDIHKQSLNDILKYAYEEYPKRNLTEIVKSLKQLKAIYYESRTNKLRFTSTAIKKIIDNDIVLMQNQIVQKNLIFIKDKQKKFEKQMRTLIKGIKKRDHMLDELIGIIGWKIFPLYFALKS